MIILWKGQLLPAVSLEELQNAYHRVQSDIILAIRAENGERAASLIYFKNAISEEWGRRYGNE